MINTCTIGMKDNVGRNNRGGIHV